MAQSDKPDSPYRITEKQKAGGEQSKSISIYFFFHLLAHSTYFQSELTSNICLDAGYAFASNFISCESARPPPKLHSVKVYNGA